jgi:hypothetical protein
MKKTPYFLIALIFLILTAACSDEEKEKEAKEEAAEEFVEKLIETAADNDIKIDIDEDNAELTVEGPEGTEFSLKSEGNEIPDNFPDDVYIVKGEIESAGSMSSNEGEVFTIGIIPEKSFKDIVALIKKEMLAKGWKSTMNMNMGDEAMQMYIKGENSATITVTKEDGKTMVGYMVTVVD